jgi:hypothetical protein
MSIRDKEIARLEKYAESLGLRVFWRKHKRGLPGAVWEIENNEVRLIMYTWPRMSKTLIILNFLHELSHHLAWVYNNRELPKSVDKAFAKEMISLTSNDKRIIYETEKEDSKYRLIIAHELDIRIPEWKIKLDIEVDIWFYYTFYKEGKYPTLTRVLAKQKELRSNYVAV